MAKGIGIVGNITGKIGNLVGYSVRNSNNKVSQGYRVYQPSIANPKTIGQATQRVKMLAAVLFYRALEGILNHSWEGVKYGGPSHQMFMKKVLANTFDQYPYLPKGTAFMVPGAYPVSRGSLGSFQPTIVTDAESADFGRIIYPISASEGVPTTLGQLSSQLIAGNSGLRDGDQLTFVLIAATGNDSQPYEVRLSRLVLNVSSALPIAQVDAWANGFITSNGVASGSFTFNTTATALDSIAGLTLIVSRPDSESGQWLRSNADLVLNTSNDELMEYFSYQQQDFAIKSYMDLVTVSSSKWYLNQGYENTGDETQNPSGGGLVVTASTNNAAGTAVQRAFYNANGRSGFLAASIVNRVNADGQTIGYSAELYTLGTDGVTLTVDSSATSLPLSTQLVPYDEVANVLATAGYSVADPEPVRP